MSENNYVMLPDPTIRKAAQWLEVGGAAIGAAVGLYFLLDLLGQSYPDGRPWLEDRTGLPLLIVALNAAMAGGAAFHALGRRRAGLKLLAISSAAICGLGLLLLSQAGGWIIPSGLIGLTSSVLGWCAGTPAPEVKAPARGKPEPAKRKLAA